MCSLTFSEECGDSERKNFLVIFIKFTGERRETASDVKLPCRESERERERERLRGRGNSRHKGTEGQGRETGRREARQEMIFLFRYFFLNLCFRGIFAITFMVILFNQQKVILLGQILVIPF